MADLFWDNFVEENGIVLNFAMSSYTFSEDELLECAKIFQQRLQHFVKTEVII